MLGDTNTVTETATVGSGPFGVAIHGATNTVDAANNSEVTMLVIAPAASTPGAPPGVHQRPEWERGAGVQLNGSTVGAMTA